MRHLCATLSLKGARILQRGREDIIGTTLPHADFGDPECCGCLNGIIFSAERADITCNECNAVVQSVPLKDLQRTLDEMELTLDVCTEMCPHCGGVNIFPGFSKMTAFTCQECGESVVLPAE